MARAIRGWPGSAYGPEQIRTYDLHPIGGESGFGRGGARMCFLTGPGGRGGGTEISSSEEEDGPGPPL